MLLTDFGELPEEMTVNNDGSLSAIRTAALGLIFAGYSMSGPANAETSGVYVSPQVGWIMTDSEREADVGVEDGLTGRLIVGYPLTSHIALEAMGFTAGLDANNGQEKGQVGGGLGLRYRPFGHGGYPLQPHITLGGGLSRVQISTGGWASNAMYELGVGANWQRGHWGLRTDVRYRFDQDDDSLSTVDSFEDLELALGLTYEFGRKQPHSQLHRSSAKEKTAAPPRQAETTSAPKPDERQTQAKQVASKAATKVGQGTPAQKQSDRKQAPAAASTAAVTTKKVAPPPRMICDISGVSSQGSSSNKAESEVRRCATAAKQQLANSADAWLIVQSFAYAAGNTTKNLVEAERRGQSVEAALIKQGITWKRIDLNAAELVFGATDSVDISRVKVFVAQ